jgi:hypothetical protein
MNALLNFIFALLGFIYSGRRLYVVSQQLEFI